jgi:hypothetical protein
MTRKRVQVGLSPEAEEALRQFLLKDAGERLDHERREQDRIIQDAAQREPTTTTREIVGSEIRQSYKDAQSGRKSREAGKRGGGRPRMLDRDIELARAYLTKKTTWTRGATNLKARIGRDSTYRLNKDAAIAAIDRGLRAIRAESAKPYKKTV